MRKRQRRSTPSPATTLMPPESGRFTPLNAGQLADIHQAALDLLANFGIANLPDELAPTLEKSGATFSNSGRLTIPPSLVERCLSEGRRDVMLWGRNELHTLDLSVPRPYFGTGGASPQIFDVEMNRFRPSLLRDIYDAARVVESLEHVAFFSRPMVATDILNARDLEINTAYASLSGTLKHVLVSASQSETVQEIAALAFAVAGGQQAFQERPFLSFNVNHVVPPMRFDRAALLVMAQALDLGVPVFVNTFSQMGASSPVTMAGCLAQTHAETLAGLVIAWAINPVGIAIYGARPMVTDLRSGGMAGGSGEQALLTAAACQLARFCDLPNSTIAGATDSKIADAQAGYEKAHALAMAAHAGANLITQAAGTQAGLMATSLAAYVIDNDMLGAQIRALSPIDVSHATLDPQAIAQTIQSEGHFLGAKDTYARMRSEFCYPILADRSSIEGWARHPSLVEKAQARVSEILSACKPQLIDREIDQKIRQRFEILLPPPEEL